MIRVLLAEDQAMMRGALAVLLDLEDDIEVVAQVSDGTEIVPAALEARPDVALLDIELPGRSGLDAASDLATELPGCRVGLIRNPHESLALADALAEHIISSLDNLSEAAQAAE